MKIESHRPSKGVLGGWLHRLADPVPVAAPRSVKKLADVGVVAKKMFRDKLAALKRAMVADKLGVTALALARLHVGIGWDWNGTEFASFPSRDAQGTIIGITRRYADGTKKTLAGTSNSGIFAIENWWKAPGPVLIVEGASDVAALVTHGFAALGRPSNVGGQRIIAAYLKRRAQGRNRLVIGENDRKPERVGTAPRWSQCLRGCFGCSWCWPGKYGAEKVSRYLGCAYRMVPQEWKDVRAWANADKEFRQNFTEWSNK